MTRANLQPADMRISTNSNALWPVQTPCIPLHIRLPNIRVYSTLPMFPAPQSPPHAREQRASHGTAGSHLTAYLMRQEAIAEDHAAATSLPEGAANRSVAQGAAGSVASGGGESWSWQGRSPRSLEQLLLQQQQRHPGPGHFLGQTPQRMSPFLPGGVRRGEQRQAVREAAGPGGPPRGGAAVQSVAAGAFASPDRPAWAMRPAGGSGPQGADLTGTKQRLLL